MWSGYSTSRYSTYSTSSYSTWNCSRKPPLRAPATAQPQRGQTLSWSAQSSPLVQLMTSLVRVAEGTDVCQLWRTQARARQRATASYCNGLVVRTLRINARIGTSATEHDPRNSDSPTTDRDRSEHPSPPESCDRGGQLWAMTNPTHWRGRPISVAMLFR